jgi:hypothetical protein
VNPPLGHPPRKRMKKYDFLILPLRTRTILRGNKCYESKILQHVEDANITYISLS